jgi:hypothetical protein
MKRRTEEIKKDSKEDVRNLLLHLESEYRKASISEKQYKELKGKYNKMLKGAPKKEVVKEELTETPEETIETSEESEEKEPEEEVPKEEEKIEEKVEKKGFFKSLFEKKKEAESEQPKQNIEQPKIDDPPSKKSNKNPPNLNFGIRNADFGIKKRLIWIHSAFPAYRQAGAIHNPQSNKRRGWRKRRRIVSLE